MVSNSTMSRPSPARRVLATQVTLYAILIFFCLLSLYPMLMMIINSFKSNQEMFINSAGLPKEWTLSSYQEIFSFHSGLMQNFLVSAIVSVTTTVGAILISAMAAYGFSKYRFKGRDVIFGLLLATLMVPQEITIPGRYIMFARMDWLNTYQILILPRMTTVMGLFLMRQFMLNIPDDLLDAARMDGAGHWTTFWKIMIPVCSPILGAYSILEFMSTWNDYLWPSIVATKQAMQPIMVVLPRLTDLETGFFKVWGTIMAGCVLSTIPILLVFLIFQDKFMTSVVVGSVKE
jgi:ABC-type glycerol-3-phosphate transport system permease component